MSETYADELSSALQWLRQGIESGDALTLLGTYWIAGFFVSVVIINAGHSWLESRAKRYANSAGLSPRFKYYRGDYCGDCGHTENGWEFCFIHNGTKTEDTSCVCPGCGARHKSIVRNGVIRQRLVGNCWEFDGFGQLPVKNKGETDED